MSTELEEVITCSSLECSSLACIIPSCVPIRAEMLLHLIDTFVIRLKPGPVVPPYGWLEIAASHPSAFLRLDTLADLAATSRFFLYRLLVDSRGSRIENPTVPRSWTSVFPHICSSGWLKLKFISLRGGEQKFVGYFLIAIKIEKLLFPEK